MSQNDKRMNSGVLWTKASDEGERQNTKMSDEKAVSRNDEQIFSTKSI
jgi:hypothetical protein